MGSMKNYRQLLKELPSKTVVFAFGRFNPPTIGHELLVRAVRKLAQQRKADHVIYASASHDAKKNPLDVNKKVGYLRLMFPNTNFMAAGGDERTFIEAARALNKRYKNIIMIAGSDRVPAFKKLLNDYNGKDFKFDTIEVVSAGERDPDADDATGMSASKMRTLASKGDYNQFKRGLPTTIRDIDGRRLMNDIRQGMGLDVVKEQLNLVKDTLREKYFRGEVFKLDDIVESDGSVYKIVKRGSNHLLLEDTTGNRVTKWIQDVSETEKAFMLQEDLTDKTLKVNTDKIKVARIIATMLGIDNAESMANPEALVNLALRKARQKALNPEALKIVAKMLTLADEVGIKYDDNLKPQKLKETITSAVTIDTSLEPKKKKKDIKEDTATTAASARTAARQSKLADLMAKHAGEKESLLTRQKKEQEQTRTQLKVHEEKDDGLVHKKSNYNLARSIMRYSDFKKSVGMTKQEAKPDDNKETESDHDASIGDASQTHTQVGQVAHNPSKDSNLRRRKVKYHLGEDLDEAHKIGDKVTITGGPADVKGKTGTIGEIRDGAFRGAPKTYTVDHEGGSVQLKKHHIKSFKEDLDESRGNADKHWDIAQGHKEKASLATKGTEKYHSHMADYHDSMHRYHSDIGQSSHASAHADKAEIHHEKAYELSSLKEGLGGGREDDEGAGRGKNPRKDFFNDRPHTVHIDGKPWKKFSNGAQANKAAETLKSQGKKATVTAHFKEETVEQSEDRDTQLKRFKKQAEEAKLSEEYCANEYGSGEVEVAHSDIRDDMTEEEIEDIIDALSDDDYLEVYEDDELAIIDAETGEQTAETEDEKGMNEELVMEVLSRMERMKSKIRIRKTAAKRERAEKIALKKYSDMGTINKRARRLAIRLMKKRMLRGRDPSKISVPEKERMERMIASRKNVVSRIATRLSPRIRKLEKNRLSHGKFTVGAAPSVF
jgi:nicotinic acid mononucleotide adenylyltransferase